MSPIKPGTKIKIYETGSSRAAAARDASVLSAHTAEEIICVVSVPAVTGPEGATIALAVVADALKAAMVALSPSQ